MCRAAVESFLVHPNPLLFLLTHMAQHNDESNIVFHAAPTGTALLGLSS